MSSGRLQLVDATGGMDVVLDLPVLPVAWEIDRILEVLLSFHPCHLVDILIGLCQVFYSVVLCIMQLYLHNFRQKILS